MKTKYAQIIQILLQLHKEFPSYNIGKHLSTALDGENLWGISDKEFLSALKKYKLELSSIKKEEDIDSILSIGKNLKNISASDIIEEEDEY